MVTGVTVPVPLKPIRVKPDPVYTSGFQAFWKLWPRKVAKGSAWDAWRANRCDDRLDAIVAVLTWQVPGDFAKRPPDKVPHAATWLNGRGWESEAPIGAAKPVIRDRLMELALADTSRGLK